jgi:hypothetical protein
MAARRRRMRKLSPVRVEDAGVVQEAVEDRRGDVGVGEGRAQVGDAAVGGKDVEPCWSRQLMIWHSGWRLRRGAVGSRARDGQPCPAVPEAHRRGPAVVERGLGSAGDQIGGGGGGVLDVGADLVGEGGRAAPRAQVGGVTRPRALSPAPTGARRCSAMTSLAAEMIRRSGSPTLATTVTIRPAWAGETL